MVAQWGSRLLGRGGGLGGARGRGRERSLYVVGNAGHGATGERPLVRCGSPGAPALADVRLQHQLRVVQLEADHGVQGGGALRGGGQVVAPVGEEGVQDISVSMVARDM